MFYKQVIFPFFELLGHPSFPLSHDVNVISADPLSVSLLFCSVLSVLRFRQFALQFRCQFGAPYPCSLARLFFLRSVVGANFVSLETGKERTRREEESAEGTTEEEADPAERGCSPSIVVSA